MFFGDCRLLRRQRAITFYGRRMLRQGCPIAFPKRLLLRAAGNFGFPCTEESPGEQDAANHCRRRYQGLMASRKLAQFVTYAGPPRENWFAMQVAPDVCSKLCRG